jgi:regulator of protease activity HflC (stomatin/prohibitin superfamily)
MVAALIIIIVLIILAGATVVGRSLRVVQQYEQGIVFRFGRVLPGVRGPGLTILRPVGDRMQKVNMQIIAMAVPAQEGITRDNVSVRVDAVVYFRVIDPIKAVVNVQNYMFAVSQQAQTSLRSIIGQSEMDQLLAERDTVNRELRRIIDEPTEGPWGIRVERVELKDVNLPEGMKRSMSRQAEAERERRARIISADGEYQASKRLAAAANVMARDPAALQLRLLQTVVEVAAEKNSTLVMPVPVELLRFFDRMAPAVAESLAVAPPPADTGDAELAAAEAESEVGGAPEVAGIADAPLPEIPEALADAPLPEIPEALADAPLPEIPEPPADAPLPEIPEPPADAPLPEIPEAPVPELDESAIPPVNEALAVPADTDATATSAFTAPPGLDDAPGPTAAPGTTGAPEARPAPPADGQETPNGRRP